MGIKGLDVLDDTPRSLESCFIIIRMRTSYGVKPKSAHGLLVR